MRLSSAGMAMVIDGEPAIRRLLAAMLSDLGCAIATGADAADLERGVRSFAPDILFLDVGVRHGDAVDLLHLLADLGFAGAVQLVSGEGPDGLDRVLAAGRDLGLSLREPMPKPFRSEAVERVLREEGLLPVAALPAAPGLGLISRPWACASGAAGLIDLAVARAPSLAGGELPSAADQLHWWSTHEDRYGRALLDLPAPASLCIELRLSAVPATIHGLRKTRHGAPRPAATIVLSEDDVFVDLPAARDLLCALRLCGATVRLTGCGARFLAVAGVDPLAVDQAVLGDGSPTADRVMPRLAEVAHRVGALLLVDDLPGSAQPGPVARRHVDLWRDPLRRWQAFPATPPSASTFAMRRRRLPGWRPIPLSEALARRVQ